MKRYKKRKDLTNEDFLELKNHIMAYRLLAIPHARRKYKANFDEVMIRLEINYHFEDYKEGLTTRLPNKNNNEIELMAKENLERLSILGKD